MTEEMYDRGNRRRKYMCKTIMRRKQSAEESAEDSAVHKKNRAAERINCSVLFMYISINRNVLCYPLHQRRPSLLKGASE